MTQDLPTLHTYGRTMDSTDRTSLAEAFGCTPQDLAQNRAGQVAKPQRVARRRSTGRSFAWVVVATTLGFPAVVFVLALGGGYEGGDDVGRPALVGGEALGAGRAAVAAGVALVAVLAWWGLMLLWGRRSERGERDVRSVEGEVEVLGSLGQPSVLVRVGGPGGVSGFVTDQQARALAAAGHVQVHYTGRSTMAEILSAETT